MDVNIGTSISPILPQHTESKHDIRDHTSDKTMLIALAIGIGAPLLYSLGKHIYNKLSTHNIVPITTTPFSEGTGNFEKRIGSSHPLTNRETFKQITVLDQSSSQVGEAQCGAHSIKNTLVGLGMLFSPQLVEKDWFERQDVYETLMNYIYDQNPQLDRNDFNRADIGIADIQNALNALMNTNPHHLNDTLQKFQLICKEAGSMFSIFNADFSSNYINSFGPLTLNSMLNLLKINEQKSSFVHGFAMGDAAAGHWLTLFLKQDDHGNKEWFGCNSYRNQSGTLRDAIALLNNVIHDPNHYIKNMYSDNFNLNFKKYNDHYFNADGSLKADPDKPSTMLQIQQDHIEDALNCFNFMREAKWLEKEHLQDKEVLDFVKTFTTFVHFMVITQDPHCIIDEAQKNRFQQIETELQTALS